MEGENIIFMCALYGQLQVGYIRKNVMHRNDLFETIKWYIFWGKMHKKRRKMLQMHCNLENIGVQCNKL